MSQTPAASLRATTFGKRPTAVIDTAPKSGPREVLERFGVGSAFRFSLFAMIAILAANWWMG